jgi:two-component system chemotaxis response regulator CheY
MIVDDSEMVRRHVAQTLIPAGFTIVEASDGADALEQLVGAGAFPSLIILDVNMPNMNGIEFLQTLRAAEKRAARVPVMMLTTEGQPRLMQEAKALGAKGWIVKPFKSEMLVAAVKKLTQAAVA